MSTPTINDVAREAGVSIATVSRALSGSRAVNATTASRVRDAAARLGYRVNPIARALRKNSTGNIGLLVPSVSNPFFTMLVDEVEQHMVSTGMSLYLCTSRDDVELESARLASLCDGAVDGILVSPCDHRSSGASLLRAQSTVPIVQLDRSAAGVDLDWIGLDDMHAMESVVAHLAAAGVRSIALVTSDARNSSGHLRTIATRAACAEHAIELRQVFEGDFSDDWGAEAARRLVDDPSRPDAIVCTDDQIATGVILELQDHGLEVPQDILVTGLDDVPHAALLSPRLTTVRQPVAGIAAEAVRLIGELLGDPPGSRRPPVRTALRGELIARTSTGS